MPLSPVEIAAKNGDLEKVRALIASGADVNAKNGSLIVAASWNHTEILKALIEGGADPNAKLVNMA